MKTLSEIAEEAGKCVKCGTCMAQCPVYAETLEEPLVARGKMGLIQAVGEGESELSKPLGKVLSQCLLCGTCSENCPNGIRADELIHEARSLLAKEKGLSLPKNVLHAVREQAHPQDLACLLGPFTMEIPQADKHRS